MRIAFRSSGGRGEYELAGSQSGLSARDMQKRSIYYELTPALILPAKSYVEIKNGKPRMRLDDRNRDIHAQRVFSSVLLMPGPSRTIQKNSDANGSEEVLREDAYTIVSIDVDVASLTTLSLVLSPTQIEVESGSYRRTISMTERLARVQKVWRTAQDHLRPVSALVLEHRDEVTRQSPNLKWIEKAAAALQAHYGTAGDILPMLEFELGLAGATEGCVDDEPLEIHEDDKATRLEASVRKVLQWRRQADRGASGSRFRTAVKQAYGYRCLFTGLRLPRAEGIPLSGVDAAHILPWRDYDLDIVGNGLCLSKTCHWAYDMGLLRLDFERQGGRYLLSVPKHVGAICKAANMDIGFFKGLEGAIPEDRLPEDPKDRPAPQFLAELNKRLYGA